MAHAHKGSFGKELPVYWPSLQALPLRIAPEELESYFENQVEESLILVLYDTELFGELQQLDRVYWVYRLKTNDFPSENIRKVHRVASVTKMPAASDYTSGINRHTHPICTIVVETTNDYYPDTRDLQITFEDVPLDPLVPLSEGQVTVSLK